MLRNREYDLFVDLYAQFREHPLRDILPARTLLAIGNFFEEQSDNIAAVAYFEELVQHYGKDSLSMKAYSRLARLYLEKLEDKNKAIEAYREAYFHSQSSEDWRKGLLLGMKKYGLTLDHLKTRE